ncbi:Nicotinate-nucleotide pyrophosphorylase [carboxylating] [Slackia heliotrinireducens]|uniref:Nicotinate-nucleotide pyrophosphorylase [carboxylating] n=1 Tax=Slackia heliotrinireducens (strain ATCC 29202 / DSM 20476 / NCTC 11029 / RHS 1) TaxID=471855 RepID=C7N657_SLAHD|nr:ModD protein [Slackia heliotrinireducens]ACV22392.1 putative molybdenum utilization protein ModD [Slackia heliotrinireducens DSM 20476]VEH00699.1 Nicotinate-nucleotide pyrophosphorylase [carboxylating] [Slackia heliotrinireducens]
MFIPENRIDYLIAEDVPYLDLTSEVLGVADQPGTMEYFTREACVLAGVDVVRCMAHALNCQVTDSRCNGEQLAEGDTIMTVEGTAADLHQLWKVGLNMFDHLSAVATKTRTMVDAAHGENPGCEILVTRKSMPGVKDLLLDAVRIGGAFPHRLGLSETVLVFEHHLTFMGGFDAFLEKLPEIRSRCIEKKLFVEADAEHARILAKAGVDGVQLDKLPAAEMAELVKELRSIDPHLTIIAAGGINPSNAAEYAATGVDGLATTAPFTAKPIDMSIRMSQR